MILNDLSNNIYVINLEERLDRKEHIIKELNKIKCNDYTLFNGINGNNINNPTILKNGMFGLVSTYLKMYDDWKLKKTETIIIIEDDCLFIEDFNSKLDDYIKNIPSNWDMMYFGGNHNKHLGITTQTINEHCLKLSHSYTAHCIILKDYVFEELISEIKNFRIENDVALANLQKKYNAYSSTLTMVSQLPSYSNIENKNVDYKYLIS
jgi:GR25 family glycosyltransferase involved in LPS biosynthesis